jgi:hypothetical protein
MAFNSSLSMTPAGHVHGETYAAAVDYLLGRQSPNGGFCFYRTFGVEEPNLFDTYHAVTALDRLGCPVPRQRALLDFLEAFAALEQMPALYYRTFTLQRLGRADLIATDTIRRLALEPPLATHLPLSAALSRLRQSVRLKRAFSGDISAPVVAASMRALQNHGAFGDTPNLEDTAAALSVLAGLGALDGRTAAAAREFVDALQVARFGFTLTPDSLTPGLDVIRAGIEASDVLGLPVRFGPDIERFVLACKAADGGFADGIEAITAASLLHGPRLHPGVEARAARQGCRGCGFARLPQALPEIESTHRAVTILQRLAAEPAQLRARAR